METAVSQYDPDTKTNFIETTTLLGQHSESTVPEDFMIGAYHLPISHPLSIWQAPPDGDKNLKLVKEHDKEDFVVVAEEARWSELSDDSDAGPVSFVDLKLSLAPVRRATRKDLVVAMKTNRTVEKRAGAVGEETSMDETKAWRRHGAHKPLRRNARKKIKARSRKRRPRRFSHLTKREDPGQTWRIAGWSTAGLGAVLVGSSFVIFSMAQEEAQAAANLPLDPAFDAQFDDHAQKFSTYSLMYVASLGVGALGVTGGLLMVYFAPEGDEDVAFEATPLPGGGILHTTVRF